MNSDAGPQFTIELDGHRFRVGARRYDLSIPLTFDRSQPNFFGVQPASGSPIQAGSFVGAVEQGGSCNCASYSLIPHCNGTHTECVGHLTSERLSVRDLLIDAFARAVLITVTPQSAAETSESTDPQPRPGDFLITRSALADASKSFHASYDAIVIRSLPNDHSKVSRQYGMGEGTPFFTAEAMQWLVARGVKHLVVDLPSVDRGSDEGKLTAHRIFWNVPRGATHVSSSTRDHCSITELAYIDSAIPDGEYLLNLQIAPFAADAAPSRPVLLSLEPA
ncbi:MAG TPA: cyclase family protein [Steroidobacteraceae bacterium]|nr:cyclase family protein [Steroidobacteraceae bacterium]